MPAGSLAVDNRLLALGIKAKRKRVAAIQAVVASCYQISVEQVTNSKKYPLTWPQQVALFIAHEILPYSLRSLATLFGCNQTTITATVSATRLRIEQRKELADDISDLTKFLIQDSSIKKVYFKSPGQEVKFTPSGDKLTISYIQEKVAEYYGLKKGSLASSKGDRRRAIARPRQVAMYLAFKLAKRDYHEIGRRFGGRDHTTVIHAVKKIEELRRVDGEISKAVAHLERVLTPIQALPPMVARAA